jgi:hypothetical protein
MVQPMKNLDMNSFVRFHSLGGSDLEGKVGTIVGIASQQAEQTFWIVKVWANNIPPSMGKASCVVMTDSCLELIMPGEEE